MLGKIRPITLRYLLFALNSILIVATLWSGLCAFGLPSVLYFLGVYSPKKRIEGVVPIVDLSKYEIKPIKTASGPGNRPAAIVQCFEPSPPPKIDAVKDNKPEESDPDAEAEKDGPLSEKWELESFVIQPKNACTYAYLKEKSPSNTSSRFRSFSSSSRRLSSSSRYRRPILHRPTGSASMKSLRIYDSKLNFEPEKIGDNFYFLMDVRMDNPGGTIFYKVAADRESTPEDSKGPYVLKKEEEPANPLVLKPEEKEEDKGSYSKYKSLKSKENDDNAGRITVPGASRSVKKSSYSKSTRSPKPSRFNRSSRPSAKDLKQLSGIRKKMTESDRKKLDDALKKGLSR